MAPHFAEVLFAVLGKKRGETGFFGKRRRIVCCRERVDAPLHRSEVRAAPKQRRDIRAGLSELGDVCVELSGAELTLEGSKAQTVSDLSACDSHTFRSLNNTHWSMSSVSHAVGGHRSK